MRGRRWWCGVAATALVAVALGSASSPPARAAVRYVDVLFEGVETTPDVVYGEAVNSRGELEQLELDVYEPAGDGAVDRALYIWVHGGNFRVGDKSSTGPLRDYVSRGWVGMSINYRLRPELVGNAAVGILTNPENVEVARAAARDAQHDLQAAVRWARAHAVELGIDPSRIAVGGISAGGITALMAAFNPADAGDSGTPGQPSDVAAAISHAGAYAPYLQGAVPAPGAPPVAMYQPVLDEQVPFASAPPSCALTIAVGNTCEFVAFAGENHRTLGTDLARDFLYRHVIAAASTIATPVGAVNDGVGARAIVETGGGGAGVGAGVVAPEDPQRAVDSAVYLVEYTGRALGLPEG